MCGNGVVGCLVNVVCCDVFNMFCWCLAILVFCFVLKFGTDQFRSQPKPTPTTYSLKDMHPNLVGVLSRLLKRPFHQKMMRNGKTMAMKTLQERLLRAGVGTKDRVHRSKTGTKQNLPGGKVINKGTLNRWLHQLK